MLCDYFSSLAHPSGLEAREVLLATETQWAILIDSHFGNHRLQSEQTVLTSTTTWENLLANLGMRFWKEKANE